MEKKVGVRKCSRGMALRCIVCKGREDATGQCRASRVSGLAQRARVPSDVVLGSTSLMVNLWLLALGCCIEMIHRRISFTTDKCTPRPVPVAGTASLHLSCSHVCPPLHAARFSILQSPPSCPLWVMLFNKYPLLHHTILRDTKQQHVVL